jgi:hypothetical protein
MWWSKPRPDLVTPEKDPVAIVQEVGLAPGSVWTVVENLPPPGFEPRTVQPASRYTDYAIPAHRQSGFATVYVLLPFTSLPSETAFKISSWNAI